MSLPNFITVTVPTWATGGNYPAGPDPWSATPMRQTPISTYWTPKTSDPAQYMNNQLGLIGDQIGNVNTNLNILDTFVTQLQNFNLVYQNVATDISTLTSGSLFLVLRDTFNHRWLAWGATGTSTNASFLTTTDILTVSSWVGLNTPSSYTALTTITSGVVDSATGNAIFSGIGSGTLHWYAVNSGTLNSNSFSTGHSENIFSCAFFNSIYLMFGFEATTLNNVAFSLASPTAVPTNISASLPATLATSSATTGYIQVKTAQSSSLIMIICRDTGLVHPNNYAYSSDGTTWTLGTISLTSGYYMVGVSYSSTLSRFMVASTNGTNSQFHTSSNGTSWTLQGTINSKVVLDLKSNFNSFLSLFTDYSYGVTIDSGATWNRGVHTLNSGSTMSGISVGDTQFMMYSPGEIVGSLVFGPPKVL